MTAIEKARVALEKARQLHHNDPADHNVVAFIDEALTWFPEIDRQIGRLVREKLELEERLSDHLGIPE